MMSERGERIEELEAKIADVSAKVPAMFAGIAKPLSELLASMIDVIAEQEEDIQALIEQNEEPTNGHW